MIRKCLHIFSTDGIPPPNLVSSWLCLRLVCLLVLMLYFYKNVTSLRARSCSSWFLVVSLMPIIVLACDMLEGEGMCVCV